MKWAPHDERPEAVKIRADTMFIDVSSKYPNWGGSLESRRSISGHMYDVGILPTPLTMEEAMLPEELR